MKLSFRWFGSKDDTIPLEFIRQIPGMDGIVGALYDVPVGEVWPLEKIVALKEEIEAHGLKFEVVESVNVHEDIKLGLSTRDRYIENYKDTIRNLASVGVRVICYNFMPVFDWTRSDLAKRMNDGSTVLAYEKTKFENIAPMKLVEKMKEDSNGYELPGWEQDRLKELKQLFKKYENVTEEDLFDHLKYFLEQIIPVCEETDIKMAIHPDDPPWTVFGLPRIVTNRQNLERIVNLVNSPSNCLTLCSGALGANINNNIPEMMRYFSSINRIAFAHIRNVKVYENGDFVEASHRSCDGSLDLYEILKALHDTHFNGYIRPDHGRMIWEEVARPGYGLYDRGLGCMYILGIWDSLDKLKEKASVQEEQQQIF
ncbi:mannonate dehydratase [Pullulanibacillus sp. KACC 23026]|uniref:mannonate dehydratase n=1 Tax=Pullulanibacillus sp. KACC 23026 TaxID=3028315 RepID=UPI0023AF0445|nr:mannonate dehydratase [Pullulanibacillus sp. KACC 23026]WEG11104.1 mannonate dehydratase [Pullulanibacillus sp. KACC 23026]